MSLESRGTVGRKNGRRIVYAFDKCTSGNTFRVPCVGAISLSPISAFVFKLNQNKLRPHSQPTLEGSENSCLPEIRVSHALTVPSQRTCPGLPHKDAWASRRPSSSYGSCWRQLPLNISAKYLRKMLSSQRSMEPP
jgi:hypothetical protein